MAKVIKENIPVVILAGGLGTRLKEETEFRPKPMVPIGGKPILWHIMKLYSHFGFCKFIICLGYKGDFIKNYFLQRSFYDSNFTINTKTGFVSEKSNKNEDEWEVTLVETGLHNQTGSRLAQVKDYIDGDNFILTYGDGISNINITELVNFHLSHNKIATLSAVYPPLRFGHLKLDGAVVQGFKEKQRFETEWINGGFCVFKKEVFTFCNTDEKNVLEQDVLPVLAENKELMAYKHSGFWYCMDTLRDKELLEGMWVNNPLWKVWSNNASDSSMNNYLYSDSKAKVYER